MNKNLDKYKSVLDSIKVSDDLKKKTLNKLLIKEEKREKKNFNKIMYPLTTVLASCFIIFSTALINSNFGQKNDILEEIIDIKDTQLAYQEKDILPKVGSLENLNQLLKDLNIISMNSNGQIESVLEADKFLADDALSSEATSKNHSTTNVQVEGVDEADIVKTDGNYIYYIANKKLYMVNVKNPQETVIEETLKYDDNILPKELYINDRKIVLILEKSSINEYEYNRTNSLICYDMIAYDSETIVITYDIRGEKDLIEGRRIELDGRYLDSRMIGEAIYFITSQNAYKTEELVLPEYKDTIKDSQKHQIKVDEMLYVPDSEETNYLTIASFNLKNNEEVTLKTILGAGQEIYCTNDNLYITFTKYINNKEGYNTKVYKFKLSNTNIISNAVGEVIGRPLTQFSMNEYNNNFLIVTTNEVWKNNSIKTKNDLYVLDEELNQISVLENIGKDESLKSVRFMGDKAYVVTFKKTDPLFVIDISNVNNPKILGELKIPGYSTYLHPYDKNHIIGIGQEVEIEKTYYGEREVNIGVKVSMFDVSDYSNPKELYTLILKDKSYTDVQYNHKSVLFSRDKKILAFPITSYDDKETRNEYLVLGIDLEKGITERKKINHGYVEKEYGYRYMELIKRGLYIEDNLYTLSDKKIEIRDLNTLEKINEIGL